MQGSRAQAPSETSAEVELASTVVSISGRKRMREASSGSRLRCVSSGYMTDARSCQRTIPTGAVTDAWARQRRAGVLGDRFFHFMWRGEVWLAYGLEDGRVRGVYCPQHCNERDHRAPSTSRVPGQEPARVALTG